VLVAQKAARQTWRFTPLNLCGYLPVNRLIFAARCEEIDPPSVMLAMFF